MENFPILSIMTFLPLIGAGIIALLKNESLHNSLTKIIITIELIFTGCLFYFFDLNNPSFQFVEKFNWISSLNVNYHIGVDGLSLVMLGITVFVTGFSVFASPCKLANSRLYHSLILLLFAGLLGTFTAQNFIHWFLYWELSLVPAYFLVKLWGGEERVKAATQFFIYTFIGSIAMFISFLAVYAACGTFEFDILSKLGEENKIGDLIIEKFVSIAINPQVLVLLIFIGVMIAFLVKVPLMPFHTWLPLTYYESPSFVTMLLTGVMSKMGLYGILRVAMPIFPSQFNIVRNYLVWLAVITIVFSTAVAMRQTNLKKIFAYSSINHLGYCMLAIFALAGLHTNSQFKAVGITGVVLQMVNHSIIAATLFYFVSIIEKRSGGISDVDAFGGIRKSMPILSGLMGIAMFASLGLPGLNGFVSEFLIFSGVFSVQPIAAAASTLGLLFTAVFILKIIQKVFNNPIAEKWSKMSDLSRTEIFVVLPSIVLIFLLGIYPMIVINFINATVILMK